MIIFRIFVSLARLTAMLAAGIFLLAAADHASAKDGVVEVPAALNPDKLSIFRVVSATGVQIYTCTRNPAGGNAQFPTGAGLVAAVAGRGAAGRSHADDRPRLGETARSLVRFGVEQKPRNGLVDWRRHARLYLADQLAAVETFPGRSGIVLADGPVLQIEQLCVRSLEDPAGGAAMRPGRPRSPGAPHIHDVRAMSACAPTYS